MNFFAIQLGAILSLLVFVQNYGPTHAAAKPCGKECPGKPKSYNSGYTKMNPPTLSAPLATATTTASAATSLTTSSTSSVSSLSELVPSSILQSGSDSDVINVLLELVQQLRMNCIQTSQIIS